MKHIALNIDDNYVDYCCVFITSCLTYNNAHFHILHNGLNEARIEQIKLSISDKGSVSFYEVDSNSFKNMPVSNQWPEAIYYRILIPQLLPSSVERVLYCDCDVMIRGSIDELWNIELEGYSIAAVEDVLSPIAPMSERLGCNPNLGYFNSGVMLLNVDYWRKNNVTDLALNYIQENLDTIKHPDQDALNYVLNKSWKRIHYKWNFLSSYQNLYYDKEHLYSDYLKKIKNFPIIIHFSGVKPWSSKCRSIYKYEYVKFMKNSNVCIPLPKNTLVDYVELAIVNVLDKAKIRKKRINYFL
ncbi:glycosyltransferase family 8 protein [Photobacterium swingsii]|uniref:glycosyltransferase family 8 protein n=1 Tax=Photobacterium swingsii TaxID=680026 RepID=UPI00406821A0